MQLLQHPIDFKLGQLEVAVCDKIKVVTIAGVGEFDIAMDPKQANGIVSKSGKVCGINYSNDDIIQRFSTPSQISELHILANLVSFIQKSW